MVRGSGVGLVIALSAAACFTDKTGTNGGGTDDGASTTGEPVTGGVGTDTSSTNASVSTDGSTDDADSTADDDTADASETGEVAEPGDVNWQVPMLSTYSGVDANASGDIVGSGTANGRVDVLGVQLSTMLTDTFLFGLDPDGNVQWLQSYGGGADEFGWNARIGVDGRPGLCGLMRTKDGQNANVGGSDLPASTYYNAFLARYDGVGSHVWSAALRSAGDVRVSRPSIESTDWLVVGGRLTAELVLDPPGVSLTTPEGMGDGFIALLDQNNDVFRLQPLLGTGDAEVVTVAFDGSGSHDHYVAGWFIGDLSLAGEDVTAPAGQRHAFVARLGTSTATPDWLVTFPATDSAQVVSLAPTPDGNLVVVGDFIGELALDDVYDSVSDDPNAFVARLNGADGAVVWSKAFGSDSGRDYPRDVDVGPGGRIAIAGEFAFDFTVEGIVLSNSGALDAFVMTLESDGTLRWVKTYGDDDDDRAVSVAFAGEDDTQQLLTSVQFSNSVTIETEAYAAETGSVIVSLVP